MCFQAGKQVAGATMPKEAKKHSGMLNKFGKNATANQKKEIKKSAGKPKTQKKAKPAAPALRMESISEEHVSASPTPPTPSSPHEPDSCCSPCAKLERRVDVESAAIEDLKDRVKRMEDELAEK